MVKRLCRSLLVVALGSGMLAGVVLSPAATARAQDAPAETVLVEALVGQIRKLNPLLATYNPVDRDITSLIFEGLTATNDYGEIVPDLATGWTISDDGLTYIVELRDDVLWQDGLPFTAADVAFTYRLVSDPRFPGPAALSNFWRTVEVDALSETLVRFRLTQPLASFPDQLRLGIVPEHALAGVAIDQLEYHPFNLSPIGTGPYQIEALTATDGVLDGIRLRVAPVYRQRPEGAEGYALDRIVFRTFDSADAALEAYANGEVNSIGRIPESHLAAARRAPGLNLYTAVAPEVGMLIYNWDRETVRFFRNPRVRLALAHSVDRDALVREFLNTVAIPADSPLLPGSWAYKPGIEWPAYDPARAQQLLEAAQLTFGEAPSPDPTEAPAEDDGEPAAADTEAPTPGPTLDATESGGEPGVDEPTATPEPTPEPMRRSLTILTRDDPALEGLAQGIASAWGQLGFSMTVESVSPNELITRLDAGDFDAAIVELSFAPSADPDPYVFWHQGQHPDGQNFGGVNDVRISEALENARREPYSINRVAYYERFQELFAQRVPALPLYYPLYTYGATSQLEGVQLGFLSTPSDRFRHIQDWTFSG